MMMMVVVIVGTARRRKAEPQLVVVMMMVVGRVEGRIVSGVRVAGRLSVTGHGFRLDAGQQRGVAQVRAFADNVSLGTARRRFQVCNNTPLVMIGIHSDG